MNKLRTTVTATATRTAKSNRLRIEYFLSDVFVTVAVVVA